MPAESMHVAINAKSFQVLPGKNLEFWQICTNGEFEPETFAIFDRFISPDHSYIDIGSWIGPTLLYGAQIAKTAYGLEPDPLAYKELAENVAVNKAFSATVKVLNVCIAPKSGMVDFGNRDAGGDSMSSLLFSNGKMKWKVAALSFEDFVSQVGVTNCAFIKIDIEGGEYDVLPTMVPYLRRYRPTVHLSLHPGFLVPLEDGGLISRICSRIISFYTTMRALQKVRFYRHIYDIHGNRLTVVRLLRIATQFFSIVLTDSDWR